MFFHNGPEAERLLSHAMVVALSIHSLSEVVEISPIAPI